jgi:hypothetical protein
MSYCTSSARAFRRRHGLGKLGATRDERTIVNSIVTIADHIDRTAEEHKAYLGMEGFLGYVVRVAGAQVLSVGLRVPTNPWISVNLSSQPSGRATRVALENVLQAQ